MKRFKRQRKRPHRIPVYLLIRVCLFEYFDRQINARKSEVHIVLRGNAKGIIRIYDDPGNRQIIVVWFDGRYYSASYGVNKFLEPCHITMAEYKRLNSHY